MSISILLSSSSCQNWPDWVTDLLNHSGITTLAEFQQKISSGVLQASQYIAGKLFVIGQNILDFAIGFGIMLYLLFFLLRDGNELATRIRKIIPLADGHKTLLLTKFTGVIRATVKGNLVVAIVQGALEVSFSGFGHRSGIAVGSDHVGAVLASSRFRWSPGFRLPFIFWQPEPSGNGVILLVFVSSSSD